MTRLTVFADDLARSLQLAREALVRDHDFIERISDLTRKSGLVARQAHREVAITHGLQSPKKLADIELPRVDMWGATGRAAVSLATTGLGAFGGTAYTHCCFHHQAPGVTGRVHLAGCAKMLATKIKASGGSPGRCQARRCARRPSRTASGRSVAPDKATENLQPRQSRWDLFRATFDNPEPNTFFVFRTRALRKIAESVAAGKENPSFSPTAASPSRESPPGSAWSDRHKRGSTCEPLPSGA